MDARDVWHLHTWFQICLNVCVCVDMLLTNAWRSRPFMQVPKFINNYLSEWISRMHKFAWEWWPLTCSHALTHACSNAAEINCTDHTPQYVLVKYLAILKGEIPGRPPYLLAVYVIIFSSKVEQAMEAFQKLWFPEVKYIRVKDGLSSVLLVSSVLTFML